MAALRALGTHDARVSARFPVMLSFFCAGVPSLEGAAGILKALEVEEVEMDLFRYRGQGWPGRTTATRKDGTESSMSYHDSWGNILSRHVQHRCKICADGAGAAADVVCVDARKADADGYPLFEEEDGINLIGSATQRAGALSPPHKMPGAWPSTAMHGRAAWYLVRPALVLAAARHPLCKAVGDFNARCWKFDSYGFL